MQYSVSDNLLPTSLDFTGRSHSCPNELVVATCRGMGNALLWTISNENGTSTNLDYFGDSGNCDIPLAKIGNNHTALLVNRNRSSTDGVFEYTSQLIVSVGTTSVNVACTLEGSINGSNSVYQRYIPISGNNNKLMITLNFVFIRVFYIIIVVVPDDINPSEVIALCLRQDADKAQHQLKWGSPSNVNDSDFYFYELKIGQNSPEIIAGARSSQINVDRTTESIDISIIAVNKCLQRSNSRMIRLQLSKCDSAVVHVPLRILVLTLCVITTLCLL